MKYRKLNILLLGILFGLYAGCEKFTEHEKFQRPDWLAGKLYTTVSVQQNLTMFAECLRLAGLDNILDVSGSWSVFAPTDEAMKQYLSENNYASVSAIPLDKLVRIAEFHIIQNPWSLEQLKSLSIYGWRTKDDGNRNSYAYKRQTMFKNPVDKYWIKKGDKKEVIVVDSTISNRYKRVFVESRKYVPIFYDQYFSVNGLTSQDFSFYFDRPYEAGNVYYAGAKILEADIFAENGFVHIIDKVVEPMLNARELLQKDIPGENYKLFLEMVYWYYPNFVPNITATFNQPEVKLGGYADTLWDLDYGNLAFDLHKERTGFEGPDVNETLVRHNGMFIPTNEAFEEFIDGILTVESGFPHWRDYQSLPWDIVNLVVAPHFKSSAIYPSTNQYRQVFKGNGRFRQNEGDIIRKEFGSNCTFIGFDSYIPDRVFTSVTGPVFLRPGFSVFRQAMLYSGIHDVIATNNGEICFFPIPDGALNVDSSLMVNWINRDQNRYNFRYYNREKLQIESLSGGAIYNRILNHVGISLPNGSANKEFIQNLAGNYIIWNNSENTVQGGSPSTVGFDGDIITVCNPVSLDEPSDNGKSWSVNYWFNFKRVNMFTVLYYDHRKFFDLLNKTGMVGHGNFPFINNYQKYTVFAPSDEAIVNSQADTLDRVDLVKFIKNHFVQGALIFTDNKQPSGNYSTAGGGILDIQTGPDVIQVLDKAGNPYVAIQEQENTTNIMVSEVSTVSAVVHEIDKVLIPN